MKKHFQSKHFQSRVSEAIRAAIKEKVAFAKHQHKRVTSSKTSRGERIDFPEFIEIAFQPALLTVSSNMKSLMVQADADCYRWMGCALVEEIEKIMTCEASSQKPDSDHHSPFSRGEKGISGKIRWSRRERTWRLKYVGAQETLGDYLRRKSLSLHVPPGLSYLEYQKKRRETFLTAVTAWNELDNSPRFRIRLHGNVRHGSRQHSNAAIDIYRDRPRQQRCGISGISGGDHIG